MIRWLTFAALMDWVITRTLTRLGIFLPKNAFAINLYEGMSQIGLIASSFAGLLAMAIVIFIAWNDFRYQRNTILPFILLLLIVFSIVFLFIPPLGWMALIAHFLILSALALLLASLNPKMKMAAFFPVLVLLLGEIYQIGPLLFEAMGWPGPPAFSTLIFRSGEFFVLLSVYVWWSMFGRKASRKLWLWALFPSLMFSGMILAASSMTSMLAIWSTGLTLYLPWPIYALAIYFVSLTLLQSYKQHRSIFYSILLIMAAGYAPQLSSQMFYALISIWLLKYADKRLPQVEPEQWLGIKFFNERMN